MERRPSHPPDGPSEHEQQTGRFLSAPAFLQGAVRRLLRNDSPRVRLSTASGATFTPVPQAMTPTPPPDHVDRLRAQWAGELPGLDTEPMAVLGRIYRIGRLVGRHVEQHFAAYGLDRGEFDVLSTLRRSGPPYRLTPTELVGSLMASSGGMSHRLGRLERAGFIARAPAEHDRRSLLVQLTPAGQALAEEAFRTDMALESAFLDGLPDDEREQLAGLLRVLLRAVEARENAPDGPGTP